MPRGSAYSLEVPAALLCLPLPPGEEMAGGGPEGQQRKRADLWPGHWLRVTDGRRWCFFIPLFMQQIFTKQ